ncbi:DUF3572 family protein [Pannonibacter sp. Pt2-lr]
MTFEKAEEMALDALLHLTRDPELTGRFLALSGIGPDRFALRQQSPDFSQVFSSFS